MPISRGGDPFYASVHGPAACRTEIRDLLDGRYELRVATPNVSGDFRVAVTLRGRSIGGSPHALTVLAPIAHHQFCEARGAALELARANLERILREIAAFRRTYPGLEEDFASHLLRQVEAHVFESMALYACTLEGRGAYREALGYVAKAELFSERRGDAWAVKVAQVVMDVAKAAFRNLGEMEAYAAAAMRQATMYGKLGLGNEFMVQAYCEATTAQIDLRDFRGAIASSTAALSARTL